MFQIHVPLFLTRQTFAYMVFGCNTLPSFMDKCRSNSAMFVHDGGIGEGEVFGVSIIASAGVSDGKIISVGGMVGDGGLVGGEVEVEISITSTVNVAVGSCAAKLIFESIPPKISPFCPQLEIEININNIRVSNNGRLYFIIHIRKNIPNLFIFR